MVIIVLKFLEIGTNKSEIMQSIVQDDNIVKALINKDADFLDTDIPDGFVRKSLIYTQVLPYKFFPNVKTEENIFISSKFRYEKDGNFFKIGYITFFIITHINLVRTNEGILRYDYVLNQIDELFNKDNSLTRIVGKMSLDVAEDLCINENWIGLLVKYRASFIQ